MEAVAIVEPSVCMRASDRVKPKREMRAVTSMKPNGKMRAIDTLKPTMEVRADAKVNPRSIVRARRKVNPRTIVRGQDPLEIQKDGASQQASEPHPLIANQCVSGIHKADASHLSLESHSENASQRISELHQISASHASNVTHKGIANHLNAGQTEATVGMVTSPEPISLDVFGVFGLPAALCKICPQYGHRIIFSRKCYYEAQCPLPVLIHKITNRGPKECSDAFVGVHPTSLLTGPGSFGRAEAAANNPVNRTTQTFPKILSPHVPPRRPALNMGKTRPDFQRALGGLQPSQ